MQPSVSAHTFWKEGNRRLLLSWIVNYLHSSIRTRPGTESSCLSGSRWAQEYGLSSIWQTILCILILTRPFSMIHPEDPHWHHWYAVILSRTSYFVFQKESIVIVQIIYIVCSSFQTFHTKYLQKYLTLQIPNFMALKYWRLGLHLVCFTEQTVCQWHYSQIKYLNTFEITFRIRSVIFFLLFELHLNFL